MSLDPRVLRAASRPRRRRRSAPSGTRAAPAACGPRRPTRTARGTSRRRPARASPRSQSWWSHHTRSPAWSLRSAAPLLGLDAVDVVEPVDLAAALAPARHAVDLLHEAAAVAGLDLELALQQAHHRLAVAQALDRVPPERHVAEVARDGQRAARRVDSPGAEAAARRGGRRASSRSASARFIRRAPRAGRSGTMPSRVGHERERARRGDRHESRRRRRPSPRWPCRGGRPRRRPRRPCPGRRSRARSPAASRRPRRDVRSGLASSVRWQPFAPWRHQNHSTVSPSRSRAVAERAGRVRRAVAARAAADLVDPAVLARGCGPARAARTNSPPASAASRRTTRSRAA